MPRYYFDLFDREPDTDTFGTDLQDDGAAAYEAVTLAGAWLSDRPATVEDAALRIVVRDSAGHAMFSVRVEVGVAMAP